MKAKIPLLSFVVAVLLAALQLGGSCVDGVTPDCSDASECGPITLDASEGSAPNPEGGTPGNDAASSSDANEAGDAPDGGG